MDPVFTYLRSGVRISLCEFYSFFKFGVGFSYLIFLTFSLLNII